MLSASNVEKLIAQLGKNQDGNSTLLLRQACLELCILLHDNKSDTARRMMRVCPVFFTNEEG
jgi:hypothetical protein